MKLLYVHICSLLYVLYCRYGSFRSVSVKKKNLCFLGWCVGFALRFVYTIWRFDGLGGGGGWIGGVYSYFRMKLG